MKATKMFLYCRWLAGAAMVLRFVLIVDVAVAVVDNGGARDQSVVKHVTHQSRPGRISVAFQPKICDPGRNCDATQYGF
jgi:hypothetical protein